MATPPRSKRMRDVLEVDEEEARDVAGEVSSERTHTKTKTMYTGKVKHMTEWFRAHYPESLDDEDKLIIPANKDRVMEFFGVLCKAANDRKKLDGPDDIPDDQDDPYSASHVKGYRSTLVDLYTSHKLKLQPDLDVELKTLLDAYEKLLNRLRQRGMMKIGEGKKKLELSGYEMLCKKFVKMSAQSVRAVAGNWKTCTFMWAYFVLLWNCMSRTESIDQLMLQHIYWEGDCLIVEQQGHKGDQKGDDKYGKHIYANPLNPWRCPILALAVYIFSYPYRSEKGRQQLFVGSNSKNRFSKDFRSVLFQLSEDEIDQLGCDPCDIGTHSCRKGGCSYCLGQVNGPSPVTVFLRMDHSLGKLKDRYIFAGDGADQLCGRMICGLDYSSPEFGILPPHFRDEGAEVLSEAFWCSIVTDYNNYPDSMKTVFPFLLASLLYHENYLRSNLDPQHPIFSSRVFTQNCHLSTLRSNIVCGISRCPYTNMVATGIPTHLAIATELREVSEEVKQLRQQMKDDRDKFPTVVGNFVVSKIQSQLEVNGAVSITPDVLNSAISSLEERILKSVQAIATCNRETPALPQQCNLSAAEHTQEWWRTFYWNDGLIYHFVPPNWRFPKGISVKTLWDL